MNKDKRSLIIRIASLVSILFVAGFFTVVGINSCEKDKEGWREITLSDGKNSVSEEFTFHYYFSGNSINKDIKSVTTEYKNITNNLSTIFEENTVTDTKNIAYINAHIGETEPFEVPTELYDALKDLYNSGDCSKYLYYGYVNDLYNNILVKDDGADISEIDPNTNEAIKEKVSKLISNAQKTSNIKMSFTSPNKVKVTVSDSYKEMMASLNSTRFITLGFFKDAYIIDQLASKLIDAKFTNGYIESNNGLKVSLGTKSTELNKKIYNKNTGEILVNDSDKLMFTSKTYSVSLYAFMQDESQEDLYYKKSNGKYMLNIFTNNGITAYSVDSIIAKSQSKTCHQIMQNIVPIFASSSFDQEKFKSLNSKSIDSYYFNGVVFVSNAK